MADLPITSLMDVTLQRIKEMVDSNTIIGTPINLKDGTFILPISKITFGFASGGSDIPTKETKENFGGGTGAGVSITPVAFLVVQESGVRLIQLADKNGTMDRIVTMMPEMMDKVSGIVNDFTAKRK